MSQKKVIVIGGPTAVGKTAMAIRIAKHFNTEIISADSRQFFKEMSIGVARPDPDELIAVPHHFIAHLSIHDHYNAGRFERDALELITRLHQQNDIVVVVGGSGMYLDALLQGVDELPEMDPAIRSGLEKIFKEEGIVVLQQKLQELDPESYAVMDINNPQRIMRALEIVLSSGKKKSDWLKQKKSDRKINFNFVPLVLECEREELYNRINERVDVMMEMGLEQEVHSLLPFKSYNALQTVGYRELFDYFEGKHSIEQAVELIKQNTRRFAKRQLTWFRSRPVYAKYTPSDYEGILEYINS